MRTMGFKSVTRSLLLCREQHEDSEQPEEDEDREFSPEKGNVAFASAHDGWAFRVGQFADLYEAKLGFKASTLIRALWGDYRIDAKSKRILRIKASQGGKYKPLFVQVTTCQYVHFAFGLGSKVSGPNQIAHHVLRARCAIYLPYVISTRMVCLMVVPPCCSSSWSPCGGRMRRLRLVQMSRASSERLSRDLASVRHVHGLLWSPSPTLNCHCSYLVSRHSTSSSAQHHMIPALRTTKSSMHGWRLAAF